MAIFGESLMRIDTGFEDFQLNFGVFKSGVFFAVIGGVGDKSKHAFCVGRAVAVCFVPTAFRTKSAISSLLADSLKSHKPKVDKFSSLKQVGTHRFDIVKTAIVGGHGGYMVVVTKSVYHGYRVFLGVNESGFASLKHFKVEVEIVFCVFVLLDLVKHFGYQVVETAVDIALAVMDDTAEMVKAFRLRGTTYGFGVKRAIDFRWTHSLSFGM